MLEDSQVSVLLTQTKLLKDSEWKPVLTSYVRSRVSARAVGGVAELGPRATLNECS